ncbi:MAG: TonB-dependent receptor domain-containing protein [Rufibacter sp.]
MKNFLLLTLFLLSSSGQLWAQPALASVKAVPAAVSVFGNGKITGTVVDSLTGKPVEFATVALIQASSKKTMDGTVTDAKGDFALGKVSDGQYLLSISFIGYTTKETRQITISNAQPEANLGRIQLSPAHTKLQEVTVVGEKPLIEDKVDRLVYNAEKDITNAGGTATEVMRKVPFVSVDHEGNLELRGSGNVRVLINNKPSSIFAGSVADALRQIPADIIKSVEVITSPTAKYDAEGTGGIINIITKKNTLQGISGSSTVSAGTQLSNVSTNVNLRQGKWGISGNIGANKYNGNSDVFGTQLNQILVKDNPATPEEEGDNPNTPEIEKQKLIQTLALQNGHHDRGGNNFFGQLGFDYDLDEKNLFAAGIRLSRGNFELDGDNQSIGYVAEQVQGTFGENQLRNNTMNLVRNRHSRVGMDINFDYTHLFKKPQQELALLGLYTQSDQRDKVEQLTLNPETQQQRALLNQNRGLNQELTLQADYTHPFDKNRILEVGGKTILRDVTSTTNYSRESGADNLDYAQNVVAGYATFTLPVNKKTVLKLGTRYEHTSVAGKFQDVTLNFINDYGNLIPNVILAYDLTTSQKLRATYTQRIHRPQLFFLNPYRQRQGITTVVSGNPTLDAELTNSYELGYSNFFKTTSLNVSAYMRSTDNSIQPLATAEGDTTYITFSNVARNRTYGLSFSGSTKPVKAWNINANANLYYVELTAPTAQNAGWMYNANISTGYEFPKGFSAQFSGGFNAPRLSLQGKNSAFYQHSLSVRKEFFQKKGSVSVSLSNPFRRSALIENEWVGNDQFTGQPFSSYTAITDYNRNVRVIFEYRFGQMKENKPPRKKKAIRNDDTGSGA